MAKYVNLDKIIAKLEKAIEEHKADISEENAITAWIFKRFIAELEKVPTVDVSPVRHGHWIYKKRTKLMSTGVARTAEEGGAYVVKKHITVKVPYCSICGERGDNALDATPFCPNCGARMDGDTDANGNDNKTPKT